MRRLGWKGSRLRHCPGLRVVWRVSTAVFPATARNGFFDAGQGHICHRCPRRACYPHGRGPVHALAGEIVCGPQGVVAGLARATVCKPLPEGCGSGWCREAGHGADHTCGGNGAVVQFESHIDHLNGEVTLVRPSRPCHPCQKCLMYCGCPGWVKRTARQKIWLQKTLIYTIRIKNN